MALRECASAAMLLLMFLCVGSAHRLLLEPLEAITRSAAKTKHIQPILGWKHDSASKLFEKPASEPWGLIVPRGEDQTNEPQDLDLDRPAEKEKQDGVEPWDLDYPTEKENQDGEPLNMYGPASSMGYWDQPAEIEEQDGESNSANGFHEDHFSGDLANSYPELYYLN